jgi:hypothetical protein
MNKYLSDLYQTHLLAEFCQYKVKENEPLKTIISGSYNLAPESIKPDIIDFYNIVESEDPVDEELDKLVDEIKDDDILELYSDDEIKILPEDTDVQLNEILSRQERIKAAIRFARTKAKREIKAHIALNKHSDRETLNKRARRLAIKIIKSKLAKAKLGELSVSEKERVEKILSLRKSLIDRLSLKMVQRVKQLEKERLS